MTAASTDRTDDLALAVELAEAAGARLTELRRGWSGDEAGLRKAGDAASQDLLAERLGQARPDDAVLSEEARDNPIRLSADRVWILDPLDGTREYGEGREDWAVHVALWQRTSADGGELTVGAVALPGRGTVLSSDPAFGAARERDLFAGAEPPGRTLRIAVSRTRPPEVAVVVAEALNAELVPMGSAGYKVTAVVLGDVDAYVHGGGQYEWDSAAPVAVARAAGVHTSRLDGSALRYNQPDPLLPDLVIARSEVAAPLLAAIAAAS
ncbi:MAG TPA: 3'(2'),5'-bisphosphate nucleotidase CysQ [Sporichthya sp.]|nr:3'(2'),5'-bisphosphate nucleotidase CysQ [Sporichthya sp.]